MNQKKYHIWNYVSYFMEIYDNMYIYMDIKYY